jgi:hypothetical protein
MQGEATDPAEVPRVRLRRSAAANYLHQRLGQNVSPNTLRSWPISYKQLGRDAVYELVDLDAFIDERLKAAPVRRSGPAPERERKLIDYDAPESGHGPPQATETPKPPKRIIPL